MPRKTSQGSAAEFFPDKLSLPSLREAAADCQACDLHLEHRRFVDDLKKLARVIK